MTLEAQALELIGLAEAVLAVAEADLSVKPNTNEWVLARAALHPQPDTSEVK